MKVYAFLIFFTATSGAPGWSQMRLPPTLGGSLAARHRMIRSVSDTVHAGAVGRDTTIYADSAVDTAAVMLPGSPSPAYPPHLKEAEIGGSVVLRFVVDEEGRPDANHVQLIKSPDPNFTAAVYRSLYYAKFKPAILRGRAVRQWVQMQFDFKVTR